MIVGGYNIEEFLSKFLNFIEVDYGTIISVLSGKSKKDLRAFKVLDSLILESDNISIAITNNKSIDETFSYWETLELFESVRTKLQTIYKLDKWMRVSPSKSHRFNSNKNSDFIIPQDRTVEALSRQLGFKDWDNDWVDISLSNNLAETDYGADGGNVLSVAVPNTNGGIYDDVISVFDEDNKFGKDISSKLSYEDDDLLSLSQNDTAESSLDILINLRAGETPEYPNLGIRRLSGANRNNINYPSIFRHVSEVLLTDSIVTKVSASDISLQEDKIIMSIKVSTRLGRDFNKHINI